MFDSGGNLSGQELYFYGIDGQKLGTYTLRSDYGQNRQTVLWDDTPTLAVFFGGKRVAVSGAAFVPDRLGSKGKYYPYGEERNSPPLANDQVKFASYTRDSATGLDYADQRYYANTFGRFMSADPYQASGGPSNPHSWNRYAYVTGDPVNKFDPSGLRECYMTETANASNRAAYAEVSPITDLAEDLGDAGRSTGQSSVLRRVDEARKQAEIEAIVAALNASLWNRKEAAALLNVEYKALLYKMKKLGIGDKALGAAAH